MSDNIDITKEELAKVRSLEEFDLVMFLSELHDHGWPVARKTLAMIPVDSPQMHGEGT